MQSFDELFGQGLMVFLLGYDLDAVEILGYAVYPSLFDGSEQVVIHYLRDDPEEVFYYDTKLNLNELMDEIVYYGGPEVDTMGTITYNEIESMEEVSGG